MIRAIEIEAPRKKVEKDWLIPAPAPERDAVHQRPKRSIMKTLPNVEGAEAEDWGLRNAHMKERKIIMSATTNGVAQTMKDTVQLS